MIRRLAGSLFVLSVCMALVGLSPGCTEKDIKVVRQTEEVHESDPAPVAPGEPIVE